MEFSKQVDNINNFIISKLAEGYTINCFKNIFGGSACWLLTTGQ